MKTPDLATSAQSERRTWLSVHHSGKETSMLRRHWTLHTYLVPELRPLVVDEQVPQISDHQLTSFNTDNQ